MESSCEEIERMLVDYADDELSPGESSKVAEHLAKCESCRRMLEALQRSLRLADVIWKDGLAETEDIHVPVRRGARRVHWPRYAALAASVVLVVGGSVVWRALTRPAKPELTLAEIERRITESASAARLLAATELLAGQPYAEDLVNSQYRYIVDRYPRTEAAGQARSKVDRLK
jgi:predicted anti-sigma-YlaC factor YlaD